MKIEYTTRIHKEGEMYVAWVPELDISSAAGTVADAQAHLAEAVTLFVEEAQHMGTLEEILEEAGEYDPQVAMVLIAEADQLDPPASS